MNNKHFLKHILQFNGDFSATEKMFFMFLFIYKCPTNKSKKVIKIYDVFTLIELFEKVAKKESEEK